MAISSDRQPLLLTTISEDGLRPKQSGAAHDTP